MNIAVLRVERTKLHHISRGHKPTIAAINLSYSRYLAPFRNESNSKATGSRKSMPNFPLFDPSPEKFRKGVSETSQSILPIQLMTKPLIYF